MSSRKTGVLRRLLKGSLEPRADCGTEDDACGGQVFSSAVAGCGYEHDHQSDDEAHFIASRMTALGQSGNRTATGGCYVKFRTSRAPSSLGLKRPSPRMSRMKPARGASVAIPTMIGSSPRWRARQAHHWSRLACRARHGEHGRRCHAKRRGSENKRGNAVPPTNRQTTSRQGSKR